MNQQSSFFIYLSDDNFTIPGTIFFYFDSLLLKSLLNSNCHNVPKKFTLRNMFDHMINEHIFIRKNFLYFFYTDFFLIIYKLILIF